jgi:hypothetical protein
VAGQLPSGDRVETKGIPFTVAAAKPKIIASANKVTLYRGDAESQGEVAFTLPAGSAPLRGENGAGTAFGAQYAVKVAGAGPFTVRYLAENRYAVAFSDQNAADTATGRTLSLELYLAGNLKRAATVKLKVAVK